MRILAACALALLAAPAAAQDDLRALISEGENLRAQYASAKIVKDELEASKQTLSGSQRALTAAVEALRRGAVELQTERDTRERIVRPHNARCGGSHEDRGFVAACNAEAARLNGWRDELLRQADGLAKYERKLQEEQQRLTRGTETWTKKKKSNNADFDELDGAFRQWQQRYNALVFNSPAYSRLAQGAPRCRPVSASDNEAALLDAHQCLQWLWDGARRRQG